LEAYTYYWSILQFHEITRPQVRIITGIISDLESEVPVNGALAVAAGVRDTTDTYAGLFYRYSNDPDQLHNGFYFLEDVAGPSAELLVSAPGYYPDTLQVTLANDFFTFRDVQLVSSLPPTLSSSTPAEGDTSFPAWDPLVITFSRPMEPVSVEGAFTAPGGVAGAIAWFDSNRRMTFTPDSILAYLTDYSLTIGGSALDAYSHAFDGNGDGVGGDDLTLSFRTGPSDLTAPQAVEVYPVHGGTGLELQPIISIAFDEELEAASVGSNSVWLVRSDDSFNVPGTLQHFAVAGRGVLNFFPSQQLSGSRQHTIWLNPGLRDLLGNETTTLDTFRFDTGNETFDATSIDDFEAGVGNWWQPTQAYVYGLAPYGNSREVSQATVNLITNSSSSMQLNYAWDTLATAWHYREFLSGGAPREVHFDAGYIMQAYVFGDGSGNKFRFVVDDNLPATAASYHEVSPWTSIDWIGWRLVSWDMIIDGTGTWLGDGVLNGTMRFDSIQLTYEPGSAASGTLYIDDLRLIQNRFFAVADDRRALPGEFVLHPNYPNPFNPATTIGYEVPQRGPVELVVYDLLGRPVRTLVQATVEPGRYRALWDGHDEAGQPVASGLYIARLEAGGFSIARKLVLAK
ncbi:MAG: Ig-like domain-containing protein, partial [Candidatus Neomarinimicrobiota bacterium]